MSLVYLKKGSFGSLDDFRNKKAVLLERFKYPLLLVALGIMLMLIPGGEKSKSGLPENDALVAHVLSSVQGVGDSIVLISDKGVVVVCDGANKAKVRLEIISAISSYTGYSSDKITILKMDD